MSRVSEIALHAPRRTASRAYGLARFWTISNLVRLLPLGAAVSAARWHGRWTYRRQRATLVDRATEMKARLDATDAQVDRWLERSYELLACEKLDAHMYPRMDTAALGRIIELRGLDHLRTALEAGNGAVLYSGHVAGHFTFFVALANHGYRLNMIGFPEEFEQWVASRKNAFMERRLGVRFLRMQRSNFGIAVKAVNALRRNELVTIEIDQTTSKPVVEAPFLGSTGYFPCGAALIARAGGAPLLPFWLHRPQSWCPQVAEIGAPQWVVKDVGEAMAVCAATLEAHIRRDPSTWLPWMFSRKLVWEPPVPD